MNPGFPGIPDLNIPDHLPEHIKIALDMSDLVQLAEEYEAMEASIAASEAGPSQPRKKRREINREREKGLDKKQAGGYRSFTMMATMKITMNAPPTFLQFKICNHATVKSNHVRGPIWHNSATISLFSTKQSLDGRLLKFHNSSLNSFVRPLLAVEPGVEASISDENVVTVKNANVLVELQDDDKMQVKVELPGKETQIVFDKVLTNLARTAPPVPGFRRQKGGKTSKVPKSFLLSIIGEDRVTKFVIQEIVSSTMADYVKKSNILVKDNKVNTIQSLEELQSSFSPGVDFGFNATLELEKPDSQISSSDSSEA
ncbi:hypothetical protein SSX86_012198 [Deinandra increscens subsp. villosa]|uniref:peptidylprolyl isomerase n=1 Tax=Deinandra increscens subsp. villosa TaxID=3103831 RepID=A0AAP0D8X3_9ASTR